MIRTFFLAIALCGIGVAPATAQTTAAPAKAVADKPYDQIEWLIGDWLSDEGANLVRQSFTWGPKQSYILYSTYTAMGGRPEALHFEGILVWNAKSRAYDYVFAIEPGSGGQEKGSIAVQPDGSIVRDVELTTAAGQVGRFRQTFRRIDDRNAVTSLMRQTANGWEPNFPGSDRIAMSRRP